MVSQPAPGRPLEQMAQIGAILDDAGVDWWADCGTLLGTVREQRLLAEDNDIDLACWADASVNWRALETTLGRAGYEVRRDGHDKVVTKYKLTAAGRLPVDLAVWRRDGSTAYSALTTTRRSPHPTGSIRWWLLGAARLATMRLVHSTSFFARSRARRASLARLGILTATWRLPAELLTGTRELFVGDVPIRVPVSAEAVLEHRYGDWRTPVGGWHFKEDDPTFTWRPPPEVEGPPPLFPTFSYRRT